jgi:hypothetical protein
MLCAARRRGPGPGIMRTRRGEGASTESKLEQSKKTGNGHREKTVKKRILYARTPPTAKQSEGGLFIDIHQIYNVDAIGWLGRLRSLPIKKRFRGGRQPDFHDGAGVPQRAAIRRECTQVSA